MVKWLLPFLSSLLLTGCLPPLTDAQIMAAYKHCQDEGSFVTAYRRDFKGRIVHIQCQSKEEGKQ